MEILKIVEGLSFDYELNLKQAPIDVRIKSDHIGKSLSLADNEKGVMLQIPLEPVLNELRKAVK